MLFKQKGGEKYSILMTPKEKLAQALFTLNFLDLRLAHTTPEGCRPRGMGWRGRQEGGSGWGTHVNPWLIHVNVWQKPHN